MLVVRVGQHWQFLGRAKRGIACDARENGRGACGKKCFDQSLESFHKLGTLDIAPPDSHKRIADTGQVPHSALSAHILRSEEHTSELQSLMRISYAVFRLKKNTNITFLIQKQLKLTTKTPP